MGSGQTALITGASRGAGVHFARELADRRFNLILSGRHRERLESVRQDLTNQYGVNVEIIPCDLDSPAGVQQLFDDCLKAADSIHFLVNNAGLGKFGPTLLQTVEEISTMIQVNVTAVTLLARLFGERMVKQGGGYILNHASFSAIQPASQYAVYSATKSYVLAFSQALRQDLKQHQVRVTALCPGFFETEFHRQAGQKPGRIVKLLMMQPQQVARAGIRGTLRGKAIVIPGLSYQLLNLSMRFLPRTVATGIADFAVKY